MFRNNVLTTRRETTDVWETKNIILEEMELGVEIILNHDRTISHYNIKLGDGVTPWNGLNYFYMNLNEEDTNEILDDFTINLATRKPVSNRIPIYNDDKGLKSGKIPDEPDDVVRLSDVSTIVDATDIPTPNKVVKYNEDAGLKSDKVPADNNDVIRKTDLDTHKSDTVAHSATSIPNALHIAMYGADTKLKSGAVATENNDVMRFLEFNNEISDINSRISTLNGAYYVLDAYDFGKILDETDPDDINTLNTYAIANTPGASSMDDVYNDTVIVNEFDTSEFVYNKISELWVKYPNGYLTIATNDHLGVVKGTLPPTDPTDETKDTYVQVLADGSMKLVGDRLGKINTVNGISPDTNKNVQTDYIYQTEADFEAAKDNIPVGATVIKMYEYPENKIYDINRPDLWPVNTEIDFGSGLYGFRKTGVANGTAQVNINIRSVTATGSSKLISQGGYVTPENSNPSYVTANPIPDFAKGFIIQDNAYGINLIISAISSGSRTDAPYDVWVTYTK